MRDGFSNCMLEFNVVRAKIDELIEYHAVLPGWDNAKRQIEDEVDKLIDKEMKILKKSVKHLRTG